ncbi:hypothetical protein ACIQXV_28705 [Neobacillus sp. NPDC097160]|uniref:YfjL-like protein n=1 Tax=Neobacillus sp. NPDC097160 TaxID=3364298 RepID=UPI00382FE720
MKKKKAIYSVLLVLLIGAVLFFYNAFNGNPISKYYSKKVLEDYLTETYPDRKFHINDGFYNFKFSEYVFEIIEIGSNAGGQEKYEIIVQGFIQPTISWDGIYYANLDEGLMEKLSQEASKELKQLLSEKISSLKGVDVFIEVQKGDFDPSVTWNKELKLQKPMWIDILLDSTNQTKEDVFNDAKKIQKIVDENGYRYSHVNINGNGFDNKYGSDKDDRGYVKYATSFDKDEKIRLKDIEEFNQ